MQRDGWAGLINEVKISWDSGDPYGSAMAWQFACADILHFERDGEPVEWQFSPGASREPEETYEADILRDYDADNIERLGNLCARIVKICKARGLDY